MAKAQFHKNQRVFVKSVGTWSIVEKIVPHWTKGINEPLRIFYEVGLGREFAAEELQADETERASVASMAEQWRIIRTRNKSKSMDECVGHPYPGTHPTIVTGDSDWGGWRVPSAEYELHPFRIEFQTAPIKGEILNPRSGDWLESMLPHELVHASHLAHIQGTSLQGFVSVFSPDFARALHFTSPAGMTEGLAVQYESSITEHGGRLNYAHFNSQYNGWGLWSAITPAGVTNPADRHYIGGSHVVDFLMDQYGETIQGLA
jgi:hypothetical protein